jgi:hypothetical protein
MLLAGPSTEMPCTIDEKRSPEHGPADTSEPGRREPTSWMREMRKRNIKAIDAEAAFVWNNRVESLSITNLSYYSTYSGEGSRLLDTSPDSDPFSKMLADAAGPILREQLKELIPGKLTKSRLSRAGGVIVVTMFDDPCLPAKASVAKLVDPDVSLLMRAAAGHSLPRFYSTLQAGADVNAASQTGFTALMAASSAGNVEMVRVLIERGARVNEKTIDGRTALHYAAEHPNTSDVMPILLKAGADINAKLGSTAQHLAGASPLIIAAAMGNAAAVKLLLDAGADENVLTADRMTALDMARRPPILLRPGHEEAVKLLEDAPHIRAHTNSE